MKGGSNNIKSLRVAAGYPLQGEFAKIIGITGAFLSEIESGKKRPSQKTIDAIRKVLRCSTDALGLGEHLDSIEDAPEMADRRLDNVQEYIAFWWQTADEDQRGEFRMMLRKNLSGFEQWIRKKERGET